MTTSSYPRAVLLVTFVTAMGLAALLTTAVVFAAGIPP